MTVALPDECLRLSDLRGATATVACALAELQGYRKPDAVNCCVAAYMLRSIGEWCSMRNTREKIPPLTPHVLRANPVSKSAARVFCKQLPADESVQTQRSATKCTGSATPSARDHHYD